MPFAFDENMDSKVGRRGMVRYQEEDGREKMSWREIDRRKDRSPHAPKEQREPQAQRPKSRRSEWMMKQYRKEVDKLFMGKKGTQKHEKSLKEIGKNHGTDQFETVAKTYIDQYGLPDDWNTLSLLLDYPDSNKVTEVIGAMEKIFETRSPVEKRGFKAKLDILAMTTTNSDLRDAAEELIKLL
jgi:hypothetical protein